MASGSRPDGTAPADLEGDADGAEGDPAVDPEEVHISWHRAGSGEQVVLGVEAGEVRVAVAFPPEAGRAELETALAERDRELEHFFDALDPDGEPPMERLQGP